MRYTLRHAIAAMAAMSLLLICGRAGFADDVNLSRAVTVQYESGETELAQLDNGAKIFTDKDFVFDNEPEEILGLTFTRRIYNHHSDATIDAPSGATVYLILGNGSRAARPRDGAHQSPGPPPTDPASNSDTLTPGPPLRGRGAPLSRRS